MPQPSSATLISFVPPPASCIEISRASASTLFSSSSLSAEAGRSTTSPAAIWLMRRSGRTRISDMHHYIRVPNIMTRVMRCHDFGSGREASRSEYREYSQGSRQCHGPKFAPAREGCSHNGRSLCRAACSYSRYELRHPSRDQSVLAATHTWFIMLGTLTLSAEKSTGLP
ncbi:hypothetical protein D3C83_09560 [compost metagenome]